MAIDFLTPLPKKAFTEFLLNISAKPEIDVWNAK
jgi:hypothetical protein